MANGWAGTGTARLVRFAGACQLPDQLSLALFGFGYASDYGRCRNHLETNIPTGPNVE